MKNLLTLIFILFLTQPMAAQEFERSVGLRYGGSNGIFFDVLNEDLSTYRFMLTWREEGRQVTAMKYYQHYKSDKIPKYLSFYYGFGAHAGYVKWVQYKQDIEHGYYWEDVTSPALGLDGLIGLSYDFERAPVSLLCEVKPYFDIWGKKIFNPVIFDFGICAVYHF